MSQYLVIIDQVFAHLNVLFFYDELKGQSYNGRLGVEKYFSETETYMKTEDPLTSCMNGTLGRVVQ